MEDARNPALVRAQSTTPAQAYVEGQNGGTGNGPPVASHWPAHTAFSAAKMCRHLRTALRKPTGAFVLRRCTSHIMYISSSSMARSQDIPHPSRPRSFTRRGRAAALRLRARPKIHLCRAKLPQVRALPTNCIGPGAGLMLGGASLRTPSSPREARCPCDPHGKTRRDHSIRCADWPCAGRPRLEVVRDRSPMGLDGQASGILSCLRGQARQECPEGRAQVWSSSSSQCEAVILSIGGALEWGPPQAVLLWVVRLS